MTTSRCVRIGVIGAGRNHDFDMAVANNLPDQHVYSNADGVHSAKPLFFFLERCNDFYVAEMQAFVDSVLTGTPPPITGLDGRLPVVMGLAARRSFDQARPVRLSEIALA